MPRFRPGEVQYVTNTTGAALPHGKPCICEGVPGVAIKQKAESPTTGLVNPPLIATGEDFILKHKHVAEVPTIAGGTRNTLIYINTTTFALSTSATGAVPFGRVADAAGQRGLPSTLMRVDMDRKV
jgi:hypothetical protein